MEENINDKREINKRDAHRNQKLVFLRLIKSNLKIYFNGKIYKPQARLINKRGKE